MRVVIIGAAGQARETAWYLDEINRESAAFRLAGFIVTDLSSIDPRRTPERLLGDYEWLADHQHDVDGIILGLGKPEARLRVARELQARFPGLHWPVVIHPSARMDVGTANLGTGTLVGAAAC